MGSPRKGYGTIIMEKLEQELKKLQAVDFEYLFLKDVNLNSCRGCCNCFFYGEDKCPVKSDDRDEIFNMMDQADGVIFMAPLYALHVPSIMKNFFDRFAYVFHMPYFFGKIAIGVCNHGIMGSRMVTKYFEEVATSWGFNFAAHLELGTLPYGGVEEKIIKKIRKTCKSFVKALNGQRYHKPKLSEILAFRVRKLLHTVAIDETNADYKYWRDQGWLEDEAKHYYDIKLGISKRIVAVIITSILKPKFKNIFAGDPKQIYKQYLKLESLQFA